MRKNKLLFQNELSYKVFAALHRFIFDFYFGVEFEKLTVKTTDLNEVECQYFADKNCKILNKLIERLELKTVDKSDYKRAELLVYALKNTSSISERKFIEELRNSKNHCIYRFLDFNVILTSLVVLRLKIIAFIKSNQLNQTNYFSNQNFQDFLLDNLTELLTCKKSVLKLNREEKSLCKKVLLKNFSDKDLTKIFDLIDGKLDIFDKYKDFTSNLIELKKIDDIGLGSKVGFLTYLLRKLNINKKKQLESEILKNDFYQLILLLNKLPKFFK